MKERQMIYPYTITAKIAQFPFKFYYNNSPFFRGWVWAIALTTPFFWKMQTLTRSPGNFAKLEAYLKKAEAEHKKHQEHLL